VALPAATDMTRAHDLGGPAPRLLLFHLLAGFLSCRCCSLLTLLQALCECVHGFSEQLCQGLQKRDEATAAATAAAAAKEFCQQLEQQQ
jgi:hypothetical protein